MSHEAQADERAGEVQQRTYRGRVPVVPYRALAEGSQPRLRALHHPLVPPEPLAGLHLGAGDPQRVEGDMARPSTPLSMRASQPMIVAACLADVCAGPTSTQDLSDDAQPEVRRSRRVGQADALELDAAIPSLSKARVEQLAAGHFIAAHESVILVGNPGTGKTHLLIALGMQAIRLGYRVRFVTAATLVNELLLARAEMRVPKLLKQYAAFELVLVDELGYVPFSREAAQLLFEFFADRYETRATALTTNLPFAQWPQVFGDETMTVALLDRLTHRSHVLLLNGESYRVRENRRRNGTTPPKEVNHKREPQA